MPYPSMYMHRRHLALSTTIFGIFHHDETCNVSGFIENNNAEFNVDDAVCTVYTLQLSNNPSSFLTHNERTGECIWCHTLQINGTYKRVMYSPKVNYAGSCCWLIVFMSVDVCWCSLPGVKFKFVSVLFFTWHNKWLKYQVLYRDISQW